MRGLLIKKKESYVRQMGQEVNCEFDPAIKVGMNFLITGRRRQKTINNLSDNKESGGHRKKIMIKR